MSEKRSIYTDVVERLAQEIAEARKRARESDVPPFMQERVSARDEARRVAAMNPGELKTYHQQVGTEHVIEALRRAWPKGGTNAK